MRLVTKWKHSFFLRPGGCQCSSICRTMYHAPILRRDIWDNCFVEVTSSGLASYPQPASPQADSMVLFGAFCNFCVQKKKKKTVPKWLEWMYFCLCTWKWSDTEVWTGTSSVLEKDGKVSVFGGLLCLFLLFFIIFCFSFHFFLFLLFYWAFYIIIKTFSTNIHREPIVGKSSCRCNDEAKPFACTALCSMALASVRPADMVLLFTILLLLLSTFWVLIALNVVTLQAKST